MAVDNIDLSGEIKAWKDAAYGKDVRAANVAAFEKIQGTVNDTVQNVNQASEDASSASQNAQKAVDDIQSAIETATSKASEASRSAAAAETSKEAAASSAEAADTSKTQAAASAAEAKKIAQGLGDFDGTAAKVKTTDTYGLVVSALGESTAQALIDAIANKVMNELINKNKIVNNLLATDAATVLAGTQGAALDKRLVAAENAITQLNSDLIPNLQNKIVYIEKYPTGDQGLDNGEQNLYSCEATAPFDCIMIANWKLWCESSNSDAWLYWMVNGAYAQGMESWDGTKNNRHIVNALVIGKYKKGQEFVVKVNGKCTIKGNNTSFTKYSFTFIPT